MIALIGAKRPEATLHGQFLRDVLEGLTAHPRILPCKYFYDRHGSELFDRIAEEPDYYLTGAETELLTMHAAAIAAALGRAVDLVELGSGSSIKTRILLDALLTPARYVPIDISGEYLFATAERLQHLYPDLAIEPMVADYSGRIDGLRAIEGTRRVVFFPGSSIGNFEPRAAVAFLDRARILAGRGGVVLVGVDLPKERAVLERAYDDRHGVTAAFNLNLMTRLQSELGAELESDAFRHAAPWQPEHSRVEMRLVATRATLIRVGGQSFPFKAGEHIVTEHCYKHDVAAFRRLAVQAGLGPGAVWFDPDERVSIHWLDA